MADNTPMTQSTSGVSGSTASSSTNTASAAGSTGAESSPTTAATKIGSMKDLQTKAPELYKLMLQGIAQHICSEMQHGQERIKKMNRQARQDAQGG